MAAYWDHALEKYVIVRLRQTYCIALNNSGICDRTFKSIIDKQYQGSHTFFEMKFHYFSMTYQGKRYIFQALSNHYLVYYKHVFLWWNNLPYTYRKTSNIRRTLEGNKIVNHSDVVGAASVGTAPTTSSFSTWHLASRDSAKTAGRQYENLLSVGIWCVLY